MRYNLNGAAATIAESLGMKLGVRRTYGGTDDNRRMHITWQILSHNNKPSGMIDLFCEDGLGHDGMKWHGEARISAPGVFQRYELLSPWDNMTGRQAKRVTRQRFHEAINGIITEIKCDNLQSTSSNAY